MNENTCQSLIEQLAKLTQLNPSYFACEIQEDGQFLLISISIPANMGKEALVTMLRDAQVLVGQLLPWRAGAYSWMINAIQNGKLVESVFGGDLLSQEAGLL